MVSLKIDRNATKPQQKSKLDRRLRSICTKLDEGNVEAGIRKAVGEDKIADFTVDNYAALKLKRPQRGTCSVPDPTDIDCFSTSAFFVHKALCPSPTAVVRVGGNRSKERYRKSELVLGSTYQIFEWDRNNSDQKLDFWETNRIAADRIF